MRRIGQIDHDYKLYSSSNNELGSALTPMNLNSKGNFLSNRRLSEQNHKPSQSALINLP